MGEHRNPMGARAIATRLADRPSMTDTSPQQVYSVTSSRFILGLTRLLAKFSWVGCHKRMTGSAKRQCAGHVANLGCYPALAGQATGYRY
jgi:hypothetical protein